MNTYKNKIILGILFLFLIVPSITVFANQPTPPANNVPATTKTKSQEKILKATTNIEDKTIQQVVVDTITLASKYVLQILLALTILVFLYGLMKFMFKGRESDTARAEGRQIMLWGIIGLFAMTSIWGLVTIAASLVGHTDIVVPQFK